MENTLKGLRGVLEVKARLLSENLGEAEVLYNSDQATTESLRNAVRRAGGERHSFIVTSVSEDV